MPEESPPERSFDGAHALSSRLGRWGLAGGVVVGSTLALGTIHATTLCIVTAALAVVAALVWIFAAREALRPAAIVVTWVAVGLTAFTLLQLVPMPASWLAVIAPHNADVWAR